MRDLAQAALLSVLLGCAAVPPSAREASPSESGEPPTAIAAPLQPPPPVPQEAAPEPAPSDSGAPCPTDMVLVLDRFCIDRYEATMVDKSSGRGFSPYYPPNRREAKKAVAGQKWGPAALGKEEIDPPVPRLPEWERGEGTEALAVSVPQVVPQAYVSKLTAKAACETAGKRLCAIDEWKLACRGEKNTRHPYGDKYKIGMCNVHGTSHPASILYGNASLGHWDPRLNQVVVNGAPLLKPTGATPTCRSAWGTDGVYDMVGNLDEWVEDGKATFVGGFYARDTFRGCDAKVSRHPAMFFDFSTGVRCCADRRGVR
jgi:formylglycine-generating enzyme